MKALLTRAGDRMLGKVLPAVTAGACVDVAGKCCSQRGYRFDCNGICQKLRCGCGWYPVGC